MTLRELYSEWKEWLCRNMIYRAEAYDFMKWVLENYPKYLDYKMK